MKTFLVLAKLDDSGVPIDLQFMAEDFSFAALIFGPLWIVYKRLWNVLLIYFVLIVLLLQLQHAEVVTEQFVDFFMLAVLVVLGYIGDSLVVNKLLKTGYQVYDLVIASSYEEAEVKYFMSEYQVNDAK